MSTASERREQRRLTWFAEIVISGAAKTAAYEGLSYEERLRVFVDLNRRVWESVHADPLPALPRAAWPGEIFDLRRE